MYTCPCCGYRTFPGPPGTFEICQVCFWEDDPVQLLEPWEPGGANQPNLVEAQANFQLYGAMEKCFVTKVKGVGRNDQLDPFWRPVRPEDRDRVPRQGSLKDRDAEEADLGYWYYWLDPGR